MQLVTIMYFYLPTKIYSEKNCVINHRKELCAYGKKAFIITGKSSSKKNGSLDAVIKALNSESIPYCIFDQVEENPTVETVMEAARIGREEKVDFVIGIGGGSPLDASKAISLMIRNIDATEDVLYKKLALPYLPVIAVPTTAGTGSEATPYAILTIHTEKTKRSISHKIYPELALVDYSYLETAPKSVLINTAVDALGHLIESYVNVNATLYSKMLCDSAFQIWGSIRDVLLDQEPMEDEFEKLMTASTMAGMAIAHTGTSLPHGISYYFTYERNIPHGKAVGLFLGEYLRKVPEEYTKDHIVKLLGFQTLDEFSLFIRKLLGDIIISNEDLERYTAGMLQNKGKLANCPYKINEITIKNMIKSSVIIY